MGAHVHLLPNHQQSIINIHPSLKDDGSLHKLENFEELLQTLIGNPQTKHNMQTHWEPFMHLIR